MRRRLRRYPLAMTFRGPYLALLLAAAAVLTACTATPAAAPVPSADPGGITATPLPETTAPPEPEADPEADEIVVGPTGFEVLDAGGAVLFAAAYDDPLDDVVAGLESVLGAAPVEGTDPGHNDRAPYATFSWDGFRLGEGYPQGGIDFDVEATGNATGDVEVRTPEGVWIGTEVATVRATYPDRYESYSDFDIARGPEVSVDESRSPARMFGVVVYLEAPITAVDRIYAPTDSWGP